MIAKHSLHRYRIQIRLHRLSLHEAKWFPARRLRSSQGLWRAERCADTSTG